MAMFCPRRTCLDVVFAHTCLLGCGSSSVEQFQKRVRLRQFLMSWARCSVQPLKVLEPETYSPTTSSTPSLHSHQFRHRRILSAIQTLKLGFSRRLKLYFHFQLA